MIERLQFTARVMRSGLYEWRGLVSGALALVGVLVTAAELVQHLAVMRTLPPSVTALVHTLSPWALFITTVAGLVGLQSKKPLVPLPPHGAPTLLDDETDGNDTRAQVPWT